MTRNEALGAEMPIKIEKPSIPFPNNMAIPAAASVASDSHEALRVLLSSYNVGRRPAGVISAGATALPPPHAWHTGTSTVHLPTMGMVGRPPNPNAAAWSFGIKPEFEALHAAASHFGAAGGNTNPNSASSKSRNPKRKLPESAHSIPRNGHDAGNRSAQSGGPLRSKQKTRSDPPSAASTSSTPRRSWPPPSASIGDIGPPTALTPSPSLSTSSRVPLRHASPHGSPWPLGMSAVAGRVVHTHFNAPDSAPPPPPPPPPPPGNQFLTPAKARFKRKKVAVACKNCIASKTACDVSRPCVRCVRLGLPNCEDRAPRVVSPAAQPQKKPRKVTIACTNCYISKSACDDNRPCRRCMRLNKPSCVDRQQRPTGRPRKKLTRAAKELLSRVWKTKEDESAAELSHAFISPREGVAAHASQPLDDELRGASPEPEVCDFMAASTPLKPFGNRTCEFQCHSKLAITNVATREKNGTAFCDLCHNLTSLRACMREKIMFAGLHGPTNAESTKLKLKCFLVVLDALYDPNEPRFMTFSIMREFMIASGYSVSKWINVRKNFEKLCKSVAVTYRPEARYAEWLVFPTGFHAPTVTYYSVFGPDVLDQLKLRLQLLESEFNAASSPACHASLHSQLRALSPRPDAVPTQQAPAPAKAALPRGDAVSSQALLLRGDAVPVPVSSSPPQKDTCGPQSSVTTSSDGLECDDGGSKSELPDKNNGTKKTERPELLHEHSVSS